ncbi:type II toxin-antitoxin system RelE/ParE family toxin [Candidatus Parcubacteria bacterium]|nr:type II toxin-antitoxin system RelE/ParE family toxin [Candidatus Parcubacteria bacterium]
MVQWKTHFTEKANDDVAILDKKVRERVFSKIRFLNENFDQIVHLPLGYKWQGFFKLRVGDWRIIYEFENNLVTIHRIKHRKNVYKK